MKLLVAALVLLTGPSCFVAGEEEEKFGVDRSFPMHYHAWNPLTEERKVIYENFMQGCRDFYGARGDRCDQTESDRIEMTLRQPQSMVNYTETGFMKIKAQEELRKLLTDHWEQNKDNGKPENWGVVSSRDLFILCLALLVAATRSPSVLCVNTSGKHLRQPLG